MQMRVSWRGCVTRILCFLRLTCPLALQADTFAATPEDRHLSFQQRKEKMIQHYRESVSGLNVAAAS